MHKLLRDLCLISLPLAVSAVHAEELDESRLWLPKNYERIYLDLKESAKAALKLDRCVKVVRGTVDLEQSSKEHPIFRIQCRQENGRTYNEMVDGLSKKTLTTVEIDESQDESELEERQKVFWRQCEKAFNTKTRLFQGLKVSEGGNVPREFSESSAKYVIDFDAEDMHGQSLQYRAICVAKMDEEPRIVVRKRRMAVNNQND